jgi:2-alkenal reductase
MSYDRARKEGARGGTRGSPTVVAVVAFVAAALGAAVVLVVGKAVGSFDEGKTQTVVLPPLPREPAATARSHVVARPLPGSAFNPARIYAARSPGVVTLFATYGSRGSLGAEEAQGSGFVVSSTGYILTNAHVITTAPDTPIRGASAVYVEFEDGDRVQAAIVGWDLYSDIGVLHVDPRAHHLTPVPLGDSSGVVVGEPVAAIGSPFGNENTLTVGVVSATRRSIESLASPYRIVDAIQTDAPINHGNSGGPLFDARGQAIGINAQIKSDTGANQGVGFAVPINSARRALRQLVTRGRVDYAYVGVTTEDLTPTLARHFGYAVRRGAVVACVSPGSPGSAAGLHAGTPAGSFNGTDFVRGGDVIVAIDGKPVQRTEDLVRIVGLELEPNAVARFRIVRGGATRVLRVRLVRRPARPSSGC